MRPENWPRVKEVFTTALELSADARREYLASASGADDELRQQVELLLASHSHASSFLETPVSVSHEFMAAKDLEGTRIGPYQVSSKIAAGGMGEVYKATDTRLDRTVAIKVLPPRFAADRVARERFEREARAVAALNHPHVCTLHDIGRQDGVDFLVMEYLEGETLAKRLEKGTLPVNQALQFAIQVASALDRVHRAGIVHRDLKPSNIMLTKVGAKLLDFGLSNASPTVSVSGQPGMTQSASDLTSTGVILGTVPYMAPEQLEGARADARSDIFAFGAIVYEMVAGHRAFTGESHSDLITAIREQDPPRLVGGPPALDRIVRTCLEKEPDERWQSARDLLRELRWIADSTDALVGPGIRPGGRLRVLTMGAAAGVVLTVAVTVLVWFLYVRRADIEVLPAQFEVATATTSQPLAFALSPDGRQLVFVAMDQGVSKLWVRPIDRVTAEPLAGTDGATDPFWSPDSRAIAFFADGKLKRLDLGRPPRILADAPTSRGGTWGAQDVIVFAPSTAGALMSVPANGGAPASVTELGDGENTHRWPHFLPDGRRFLYLSALGRSGTHGVFMASLDGGIAKRVLQEDGPAIFVAPGTLLVVRRGTLVAMPFDPDIGEALASEAVAVAQPVGFDAVIVRGAFAASNTGILAYRQTISGPRQLVWTDRVGTVKSVIGDADESAVASPEISRDGLRLATFRTVEGNADIWLTQLDGGASSRFTSRSTPDIFPLWFPDGRRLVFTASRHGTFDLYEKAIDGGDEGRLLLHSPHVKAPVDFSPDGRLLLYAVQVPKTGVDLWAMPLNGDLKPFPVIESPFNEMAGQFSPNGRSLAYESNSSGRLDVFVRSFPENGSSWRVSPHGGSQARWSRDGSELFYVAADGRMMTVPTRFNSAGQMQAPGQAMPLFLTHLAGGANIPPAVGSKQQYAVAPDGRFLMNVSVEAASAPPITVVLNWRSALAAARR